MRIMIRELWLAIVFTLASYAYSQMTWTPIFVSGESQVDFWTQSETGCECSFNTSSKNCACCVLSGGCSCGIAMPKRCAQCGLEKYCTNMCNITLDSKQLLRKSNRAFGQIKSPSVIGPTECTYRFIPDIGQRVELQIYRLISIGRHNGTACEGGWLELEGGARICGSNARFDRPVVLFSDKTEATLRMQIHENTTRSQFLAYFSFASKASTSVGWPMRGGKAINNTASIFWSDKYGNENCDNILRTDLVYQHFMYCKDCDWIFEDCLNTDCILASPAYPGLYPANIRCRYLIKSNITVSITLVFNSLLLSFNHCTDDYVAIYAGSNVSSTMLKKLCNNEKMSIVHVGTELLVEFKSGSEMSPFNYNGFSAQVTVNELTTLPPTTTTSFYSTIKSIEDSGNNSIINDVTKYNNRNLKDLRSNPTFVVGSSTTATGCDLEIDGNKSRFGHYNTRGKIQSAGCHFVLRGRIHDTVHILLISYNLSAPSCKTVIEIWDNGSSSVDEKNQKIIKKICSPAQTVKRQRQFNHSERYSEPEHYSSTGRELTIVFKRADNKTDDQQFVEFSYYFHDEGEGGTLRPSSTCDVEYYGLSSLSKGQLTNPIFKFFTTQDYIKCKQHFIPATNQSVVLTVDNGITNESSNKSCNTLCGDNGCHCVSDKHLDEINHVKLVSEPNNVVICLCGNYKNWLPLTIRSWSPLYIEWSRSSGTDLNVKAAYKFIEDTYCGDHSTTQLEGIVKAGDLTNNAITNQYYQQKCTWILDSTIDRQLTVEVESSQDRPCTSWNLTIHEYSRSENPLGQRLYTFCSRDKQKNFTLPWKMNTAIIRLQALSRTAPQYVIKWRSVTTLGSTRKNQPSPAPDYVLKSSQSTINNIIRHHYYYYYYTIVLSINFIFITFILY